MSDSISFAGRITARLQRYEFELLAPTCGRDDSGSIREICRFRSGVYREFGSLPRGPDDNFDAGDRIAWHIVARGEGSIIGCVRCIVFDDASARDVPESILRYSCCALRLGDRVRCIAAMRSFIASRWPPHSVFPHARLVQFGGLAVSSRYRRSPVAIGLCLAATAFTRAVGSPGGLVLAAEKSRPEALFQQAGGFRLCLDGEPLAPLLDQFHLDRIILLGTSPFGNAARLESSVTHFSSSLFSEHTGTEVICA